MLGLLERLDDMIDRSVPTMRFPHGIYRLVDETALDIVEPGLVARHLRNDGLQHREAVDQIVVVAFGQLLVDHSERVDRDTR